MASSSSSSSNDEMGCVLLEDIIFEILLWLPMVSILRFKSVCKSWLSLIESPRFVSQQFKNNRTEEEKLIILQYREVSGPYCMLLSSSFPRHGNKFEVSEKLDLPEYLNNNPREIRYGKMISCNGIVCLHHHHWDLYNQDISLWNPATKKFRILPKSPFPPPRGSSVNIGFGFNLTTNDLKVVKLCFFPSQPDSVTNQVEVYTFSTNSWKSFGHVDLPIDFVVSDPKTPYGNGDIYCWLGRNFNTGGGMIHILMFNFSTEVFETVPLPKHDWDSFRYPTLAILRGKIAVIASVRHPEFSEDNYISLYRICVMNEYGVKDSWSTVYTVGPFSFFSQPAGFLKNEDLFLFLKGGPGREQLCVCDLATKEINILPEQDSSLNLQVVVYKESLFSVE